MQTTCATQTLAWFPFRMVWSALSQKAVHGATSRLLDGAVQACGFELIFEEAAEGGQEEAFAVLSDDCELALLQAALQLLGQAEPSPSPRPQQPGMPSIFSSIKTVCGTIWLVPLGQDDVPDVSVNTNGLQESKDVSVGGSCRRRQVFFRSSLHLFLADCCACGSQCSCRPTAAQHTGQRSPGIFVVTP